MQLLHNYCSAFCSLHEAVLMRCLQPVCMSAMGNSHLYQRSNHCIGFGPAHEAAYAKQVRVHRLQCLCAARLLQSHQLVVNDVSTSLLATLAGDPI